MKRPLIVAGLGFAIATWASFFVGINLIAASVVCASAGAIAFLPRRKNIAVAVFLLSAAMSLAVRFVHDSRFVRPLLEHVGETVTVQGVIIQADYAPPAYTFILRAEFPDGDLPSTTLNVRGYGEPEYLTGDILRCTVRLEELRSSQQYYNSWGIFVSARLLETQPPGKLPPMQAVERLFVRMRAGMLNNLRDNLPADAAELLAGMVLGERSGLDNQAYGALSRAGTAHLLSVSGLHLAVMVGFFTKLAERFTKNKKLRALAGGTGAILFAALTGFSPSMSRALVMALVTLLAQAGPRRSDSLSSLSLAILIICVAAPHWTLNAGLWLSAASTAGIAVLNRPLEQKFLERYRRDSRLIQKISRIFLGAAAIAIGAYAFSFPVLLLTSGWASLAAPAANVLIAPLVAPALLCGMLCALFSGVAVAPFATAATVCVRLILGVSEIIAKIPLTFALDQLWRVVWLILAAGIIILLFVWRAGKNLWRYGAALLAIAFAAGSVTSGIGMRDKVELIAIDRCSPVILLRENSAVVVGTPSIYEIGRLTRYLEFRGINGLDAIIAHDQGEQIGSGLIRLAAQYDAGMIIGPDDDYILSEIARAIPGIEVLSSGYADIRVLDGVHISASLLTDEVEISAGSITAVKTGKEYVIMEDTGFSPDPRIRIWSGGVLVWPERAPPAFEPIGGMIFGERRIIIDC